jgi:hypothetical protein
VRMRNRNPWVLARRRLFGWNVRLPLLTAVVLPVLGARFEIVGSQPSGLRRCGRLVAYRHRWHHCETTSPGQRRRISRGRGHARMPTGGRETPRA